MKDLEKIIEECLRKIEKGEATVEECLKAYPQHKEELEAILSTAQMLRTSPPSPPQEFKEALRRKLVKEFSEKSKKKKILSFALPRRKALALLLAAVFVLTMVGIGYTASRETNPNSPLYPVKIALEKVRLVFAREPVQKLELHLEYANHRLQELKNLKENNRKTKDLTEALNKEIKEAKKLFNSLSHQERKEAEKTIQQMLNQEETLKEMFEEEKSEPEKPHEPEEFQKETGPEKKGQEKSPNFEKEENEPNKESNHSEEENENMNENMKDRKDSRSSRGKCPQKRH